MNLTLAQAIPQDNHEAMLFLSRAIVKALEPEAMDVLIASYSAVYFSEYGPKFCDASVAPEADALFESGYYCGEAPECVACKNCLEHCRCEMRKVCGQ